MMKENIKNQIVDIDGYVHVVNGKVICVCSGALDLTQDEDLEEVFSIASVLGTKDFPLKFGKDTMIVLGVEPVVGSYNISYGYVRVLPDDIQEKVLLAILRYNNQIIDIDGYVHVVNGKVICFEPDVYDLNNPDDVEILLDFVSYISNPDNHECTWFGDSNTIYLRSLYKNDCKKVVLGIGHFNCLEDDVKERVRSAIDEFRGGTGN